MSTPLILAHRGLVTRHQENTYDAVSAAMASPYCHGAEIDVFMTKDKKIVLCHDENILRLTGVNANVWDLTWSQLKDIPILDTLKLDGDTVKYEAPQKFCLLDDILKLVIDTDFLLNIELKAYMPKWSRRHTGTEVGNLLKKYGVPDNIICTSFDFFMLRYLEAACPEVDSGIAYDRVESISVKIIQWAMKRNFIGRCLHSTVVDVEFSMLTTSIVEKHHGRNMRVGAYTLFPLPINSQKSDEAYHAESVSKLVRLGVDWIETDQPKNVYDIAYRGE